MSRLYLVILAGFLVISILGNNCSQADSLQCGSSLCPQYSFSNNLCVLNTSAPCTAVGQVNVGGTCVFCSTLAQTNCSTLCTDYLWTSLSSAPSMCTSCELVYSPECIQCSASACLACSASSKLVVSFDGLTCVATSCTWSSNCLECSVDKVSCFKCKQGYSLTINNTCEAAHCNITNCGVCLNTLCGSCYSGYTLASDQTSCLPLCEDIFCLTCSKPNFCKTCQSPYFPDTTGKCMINCALINVTNCLLCSAADTCHQCLTGYTAVQGGNLCQLDCTITNCYLCPGNPQVCQICHPGYVVASNGAACASVVCAVAYCAVCGSVDTCSACQTGFSLTNSTTCTSNAPAAGLPNCLLASGTLCLVCEQGYVLSSAGGCVLICAGITNCQSCISTLLCGSCATGFTLAPDYKSCLATCVDSGCGSCSNSTVLTCSSCLSNFYAVNLVNNANSLTWCMAACGPQQFNYLNPWNPDCFSCKSIIPNCAECGSVGGQLMCSRCLGGYFMSGKGCMGCATAISNCLTCHTTTTCTACSMVYIIQILCASGNCPHNANQCVTCSTATTCLQCQPGYFNVNGECSQTTCTVVIPNCLVCLSSNSSQCGACRPGYQLLNNACSAPACISSQVYDHTTGLCVCPPGTFLAGSAASPQCQSCRMNCINCTFSICHQCRQGYYPQKDGCVSCPPNCRKCHDWRSCSQCQDGFTLDLVVDGGCYSLGDGQNAALDAQNVYGRCQPGCQDCTWSVLVSRGISSFCEVPSYGYSIVGGDLTKCHPNCLACQSYISSVCTACYPGSFLISGVCSSCTDPNALTCSPLDPAYSLSCKDGYTSGHYPSVPSPGGTCLACSLYCRSCLQTGPNNCDSNSCINGTVQLLGTTNCTVCFKGCSSCSPSNPGLCLDCGLRKYMDVNGNCLACEVGCRTCRGVGLCGSCLLGYSLVGSACVLMPQNCGAVDALGRCTSCFLGYSVVSDLCVSDLACNSNNSCQACPSGYYLSTTSACLSCVLPSNCKQCNDTSCTQCQSGYYLDSSFSCQICPLNCLACSSASFCTVPAIGYYLVLSPSNAVTGSVGQCYQSCATCLNFPTFCLSCISGYKLVGSSCQQSLYLALTLTIAQTSTNTIFTNTLPAQQQLYLTLRAINRIGSSIDAATPVSFKDGRDWRERLIFNSISSQPVTIYAFLDAGTNTDQVAMQTAMTSALSSFVFDGFVLTQNTATSFVRSSHGSSSEDGSSTYTFVMVLMIPLGMLVLLVVLLMLKYCREEDQNANLWDEEDKNNDMYESRQGRFEENF